MKNLKRSALALLVMVALAATTGCVEHRYYRENHRHSENWERRHHHEPRVDVNIHN